MLKLKIVIQIVKAELSPVLVFLLALIQLAGLRWACSDQSCGREAVVQGDNGGSDWRGCWRRGEQHGFQKDGDT